MFFANRQLITQILTLFYWKKFLLFVQQSYKIATFGGKQPKQRFEGDKAEINVIS